MNLISAAVSFALIASSSVFFSSAIDQAELDSASEIHSPTNLTTNSTYPGATALYGGSWDTPSHKEDALTNNGAISPTNKPLNKLHLASDQPAYYADGCHASNTMDSPSPDTCRYGAVGSPTKVALVGSSKSGGYFEPLEKIALREGWELVVMTKSSCDYNPHLNSHILNCNAFNDRVEEWLKGTSPMVVFQTPYTASFFQGDSWSAKDVNTLADAYKKSWDELEASGVKKVVSLWDSPYPSSTTSNFRHPVDCLPDAVNNKKPYQGCKVTLTEGLSGAVNVKASASSPLATPVSLRDWVCPPSSLSPSCPAVIGKVSVYGSSTHMAAGYMATLVEPLAHDLEKVGVFSLTAKEAKRIGGEDRYHTASLLSSSVGSSSTVFLANGQTYVDALSASAAAGSQNSTVLLVKKDQIPAKTKTALRRLAPDRIVVVGSTAAISNKVLEESRGYSASVVRATGSDRYATAATIAKNYTGSSSTVYLSNGQTFADALVASPAAAKQGGKILLTKHDHLPKATIDTLKVLNPSKIVVMGGPTVVKNSVAEQAATAAGLGTRYTRVGGSDRYETAKLLSATFPKGTPVYLASGQSMVDALAVGPIAARKNGAVLLTKSNDLPNATGKALEALAPANATVVGSVNAVSEKVRRAVSRYL